MIIEEEAVGFEANEVYLLQMMEAQVEEVVALAHLHLAELDS